MKKLLEIPEGLTVIATGPLTSEDSFRTIKRVNRRGLSLLL